MTNLEPEASAPAPASRAQRPAPIPRVHGADEQDAISIDVLRYVRLAELVLEAERVPRDAEMSVFFVDEPTIAELNIRFLEGSGPTDVLAFPLDEELLGGRHPDQGGRGPGSGDESDGSEPPVLIGDVMVCPTIAAAQAAAAGGSFDDEMALLVVHGTLHLLRYDHAEPEERERMQARERELLARFAEQERPGEQSS